jgi:tripartite-type tricarboxylate transporter receptor subunit TctC
VILRRQFLAGAAALGLVRAGRAAETITLLVGAKPGSATDTVARAFAPFLARHLPDTDIAIRNVAEGAGLAAAQMLAAASRSGTTLGWAATPTLPARMVDRGAVDLMQRIVLLGAVEREPIAFVSATATPLGSVQDIIGRSAEDADAVPLGTPPPGSPPHLAALRLQALAGTRLNIVAFPSANAARQAAVSGNVAAAALALSNAVGDLREGNLMGLGIAADNRTEAFPDMPVLRDSGIDLSAVIRRGLAAPSGLPEEIAARLRAALEQVANDPEFSDQANANGFLAAWVDGADWTATCSAEQRELTELWATEPWLQEGAG